MASKDSMLTIFSSPKPFTDPHIRIIQRNAIGSWLAITPRPEIILFGEDDGVAAVARELGLRHHPKVRCNEYGTPLVSDMFRQAELVSRNRIFCFVNADMIFPGNIMNEVQRISSRWFVAVGQRWTADIIDEIDLGNPVWRQDLHSWLTSNAKLDVVSAIDYLIFSRGVFGDMPDFAVGRPAFDNWLIFRALTRGAALVDVTRMILALHQNHGYTHVAGGDGRSWNGPEADRNRLFAEGHLFDISDCRYELTNHGMRPMRDGEHVYRRVERLGILRPRLARVLFSWKLKYLLCRLFPSL